jgi:hypothetical protein
MTEIFSCDRDASSLRAKKFHKPMAAAIKSGEDILRLRVLVEPSNTTFFVMNSAVISQRTLTTSLRLLRAVLSRERKNLLQNYRWFHSHGDESPPARPPLALQ